MMDRGEEEVLAAAIRRFPDESAAIREHARRHQAFRDMCEELAAADAALVRTEVMPPGLRSERRGECEGWIERLTEEIGEALARSNVVRLPPGRQGIGR